MPDLNQIQLNGTTYDIADEVSRSELSDLKNALNDKAPIIIVTDEGKITDLSGVEYADDSGPTSVSVTGLGLNRLLAFDGENLLGDISKWRTDTNGGLSSIEYFNDHIRLNGTNNDTVRFYYGGGYKSKLELSTPIVAGETINIAGFWLGTKSGSTEKVKLNIYFFNSNGRTIDDKQIFFASDSGFHVAFTLSQDVYSIAVYIIPISSSSWTAENVDIYPVLFTGNKYIKKTYTSIPSGAEYALDAKTISEWEILDTTPYQHKIVYNADTKAYVDNHVPDDYVKHSEITDFIGYDNLKYRSPEMFGAIGDGVHDDTSAVQACIDYCIKRTTENSIPVRGYGIYKTSSSIIIHGYNPDVYINQINYTGDEAAVVIHCAYGHLTFGKVFAVDGGTFAVGIRCSRAAVTERICDGYEISYLECAYIRANGNSIELIAEPGGASESLYYNVLRLPSLTSTNGNCIYSNTHLIAETDIYGKYCNAPNGYLFYWENGGSNVTHNLVRLHQFSIEGALKNGVKGNVALIECRTRELQDKHNAENDSGWLFDFTGIVPAANKDSFGGDIALTSIKTNGALTFDDVVARTKAAFENGASDYTGWSVFGIEGKSYALLKNVTLSSTSYMGGTQRSLPPGDAYVYYNHIAYKPYDDWYELIDNDFAVQNDYATGYKTPTIFDIDGQAVEIHLDYSYCCLAINRFRVIQHTGKTAKVYDKIGNLIFDGTNAGIGVFTFLCSRVPLENYSITLADGTIKTAPAAYLQRVYTGENEKWTISKEELIEA